LIKGEPTGELHVAVCVCTYRRPRQLGRLLDSFRFMARPPLTSFVIVDNDGDDPEVRKKIHAFRSECGSRVEYLVERKPGISAARNAAFAVARSLGAQAVAMLDDDERVSPLWLSSLLEARNNSGAAIVGGPVHPILPDSKRRFAKYARLWSVPKVLLHGRPYVYCTCNFLIELSAAATLGDEPFVREFGSTGGEDAVFFRRLFFAGVEMAWSEEAVLFEEISEARASVGWLRRRWYRMGNVGLRCERAAPDPEALSPLLKTILLSLRLLVLPVYNFEVLGSPLLWLLEADRIRGRLASHLGIVFHEYGREEPG